MGQISIDCPNCSTSRANFSTHKSRVIKYNFGTMYATCALCNDGVIIWLEAISSREFGHPENYLDINFLDDYIITSISPEPSAIAEVENLPPNVEGTLFEAEHAFSSSLFSAAAGMYRKAIERTLKLNWSELEGSLAQRIKQLGESNEIPNQLVDLLNAVRFLGNDAM
ncbi:MAG: DUF4145 domain-containing protein, partial [Cognatishimia sp.]|uniref:DUF4145 domain-containing protein n=1 Tax=Cognatishimia sp. TaxID=2211648 RepID=UPI0040589B2F